MKYQEICMEQTHSRSKCKREFKGVLNKVLVSGLILATVLGSSTTAFAYSGNIQDAVNNAMNNSTTQITSEYGVSVESAISQIRNTINSINQMKANGSVSDSYIKTLASQIYALETAATSDGSKMDEVASVLTAAESSVKGLSNASEAEVAIAIVRGTLGIDSVSVSNKSEAITSYSDVKQGDWYYDAVMDMTKMGLFSGTGGGKFSPNNTMTCGEFLTVVIRYLYGDELSAMGAVPQGVHWADNARIIALDHDIINDNEIDEGDLSRNMTRKEMAMVLVRAADANGESKPRQIDPSKVIDYQSIGTYYRSYVIDAISRGMIAGTSADASKHTLTFSPEGVLTRGQAATVLYRLVNQDNRGEVDYQTPTVKPSNPSENQGQGQTWNEGQTHSIPKVGDTVIKADGTKVVLKETNGILGFGQGVDIITGTTINGVSAREGIASWYDQTPFVKCPITGEMYSQTQWVEIERITWPTGLVGEYDGEVYNTYYKWSEQEQYWNWIGPNYMG